jgi:hypothetical protein
MTKVTNTSKIVRGVLVKEGDSTRTVHLKPGKSIEADFDEAYLKKLSGRDVFKIERSASSDADGDLSRLTVEELKDLAAKEEIDLGDATKKADIVSAIQLGREAKA